ncbi:hypothetical protein P7L87_26350 [Vibrio parahaemolyticus]|nr:hypothetical protein [Vibrio parahaemolyticus]
MTDSSGQPRVDMLCPACRIGRMMSWRLDRKTDCHLECRSRQSRTIRSQADLGTPPFKGAHILAATTSRLFEQTAV